ncbi:bifunctional DNA primase/polymerase [Streptomyces sp. MMCC 100]|uniref:bifunctional DNA primase/polymerase n=1 Tax=Streptomyces sp. MMCC 100 TaxID=3163555 RepID=UPI003596CB44
MKPWTQARDSALWLVERQFAVSPADNPLTERCTGIGRGHDPAACEDRGKHPCVPFSRVHTTDPKQVQRWFGGEARNVAVAVGDVRGPAGERLLVMDSDRVGAIEDTAAALGHPWLPTMRVNTGKGYHDYLWAPPEVQLGNGLGALRGKFDGDVRAGNAYVIGPGSLHASGAVYELVDPEQPPMAAPEWLLDALTGCSKQRTPEPVHQRPLRMPAGRKSAVLTGLVKTVLDSREGERNSRLYWAAARAFEHARQGLVDARAVADAMVDAAKHIGLSEAEARRTVTSAYRSGAAR